MHFNTPSILLQYCMCICIYIYMYACISIYICPMFDGIKASALPRDIAVVQSAPWRNDRPATGFFWSKNWSFFAEKKLPGAKHREWGNGMVVDTFFVWEWDLIDFFGGKNYLSLGLLITINNHPIPPFPTFSTSKKSGMWPLNNWGFGKGVWKLPWISNVTWWYLSI